MGTCNLLLHVPTRRPGNGRPGGRTDQPGSSAGGQSAESTTSDDCLGSALEDQPNGMLRVGHIGHVGGKCCPELDSELAEQPHCGRLSQHGRLPRHARRRRRGQPMPPGHPLRRADRRLSRWPRDQAPAARPGGQPVSAGSPLAASAHRRRVDGANWEEAADELDEVGGALLPACSLRPTPVNWSSSTTTTRPFAQRSTWSDSASAKANTAISRRRSRQRSTSCVTRSTRTCSRSPGTGTPSSDAPPLARHARGVVAHVPSGRADQADPALLEVDAAAGTHCTVISTGTWSSLSRSSST